MMSFILCILLLLGTETEVIKQFFLNQQNSPNIEIISIKVPPGLTNIKPDQGKNITYNRSTAFIQITGIKGKRKINSYAELKFKEYDIAFIAKNNIESKKPLDSTMFRTQKIEVSGSKRKAFSGNEFTLIRSNQFIKMGSILYFDQIESLPAIKEGENIKIFYKSDNVIIETIGVARKDGIINQVIPVITKENKTVKAKIIDSTRAEIVL